MPKDGNDRRGQITEIRRRYQALARTIKGFPQEGPAQESLAELSMYLENIYKNTEQFYKKDKNGNYPIVDTITLERLSKNYRSALKACDAVLKAEGQTPAMTELANEVKALLSKDSSALETAVVNKNSNYTLGEIIELGRSKTVDVGNAELNASSGQMSARIPLNIEGLGDGFFTKSTIADPYTRMNLFIDGLENKYPDMSEVLEELREAGPGNVGCICVNKLYDLFTLGRQLNAKLELSNDIEGMEADAKKYYAMMSGSVIKPATLKKAMQNPDFLQCMLEFSEKMPPIINEYEFYVKDHKDGLSVGEGANIDKRNSAMSSISTLLGKKGLIAEAEPVIVISNGIPSSGTFMKKSEGWEISNHDPKNPMALKDPETFDNHELFDDIAAIQAMDYICGNIDRHEGNFFFTFSNVNGKMKATGVTGIDNDMSFGNTKPENESHTIGNIFIRPENMGVIGEEFATKVMELDRPKLELALRGHGISTEEVDSAWKRTQHLQDEIRKGLEHYKDVEHGKVDKGFLRIVPKDKWKKYNLKEIGKRKDPLDRPLNQFGVLDNMVYLYEKSVIDERDRAKEKKYEDIVRKKVYGTEPPVKKPFAFNKTVKVGEGLKAAEDAYAKFGVANPEQIKVKLKADQVLATAMGGSTNSRFPISYDVNEKEKQKGYFTASIYTDGKDKVRNTANSLIAKAKKEGRSETEIMVYSLLADDIIQDFSRTTDIGINYDDPKLYIGLGLDKKTAEDIVADEEMSHRIRTFNSKIDQVHEEIENQYLSEEETSIGAAEGGTIDKRNVTFYKMSELFGVSHIVPFTTNMQVEVDGKITDGTFMATAEGTTLEALGPDDPMAKMSSADFTGSALRDLADLQILDYLAMNADRNRGNYSFVYSEGPDPKCIGVRAIDNDYSYGTIDPGTIRNSSFVNLSEINVISETMAERIRNMDPDALRITYQGQGLSDREIEAAVGRFLNVQDKLERGGLEVVPDNEWNNRTLDSLAGDGKSIYKRIKVDVISVIPRFLDGAEKKETKYAEAARVNDFSEEVKEATDLTHIEQELELGAVKSMTASVTELPEDKAIDKKAFIDKSFELLSRIKKDLSTADSIFFKSSPEYKLMKKAVNKAYNMVKDIKEDIEDGGQEVPDVDLKKIAQNMKHIENLSDSYSDYKKRQLKNEHRNPTRVERLRLQASENVKTVGKSMSELVLKALRDEHRFDNVEEGIRERVQDYQKKLAENHYDNMDFQRGLASILYINGVSKNRSKIGSDKKISNSLSDKSIERNAEEIMKTPGFKQMIRNTDKEDLLALAGKANGQFLFKEYIKNMAKVQQKEEKKVKTNEPKPAAKDAERVAGK